MSAPMSMHIHDALYVAGAVDRIAAALIAGDDAEAGRLIREAVGVAMAEWRELEAERQAQRDEDEASHAR